MSDELEKLRSEVAKLTSERDHLVHLVQGALADMERQGYQREIFALKDGLRGWKELAKNAEERAEKYDELQQAIDMAMAELNAIAPTACGALFERIREAVAIHREGVLVDAANELERRQWGNPHSAVLHEIETLLRDMAKKARSFRW